MTLSTSSATPRPAVFPLVSTPGQSQLAADAKARGYTQGHAAGYATGLQQASLEAATTRAHQDAEHHARMSALESRFSAEVSALKMIADALTERTVPVLADAEQVLFSCALDLAVALLGHELRDGETSARAALARAVTGGGEEIPVAISMNPADLALLRDGSGDLPETLTLVADPALNRGDAVAQYPYGFLDARLSTATARVRAALSGESMTSNQTVNP